MLGTLTLCALKNRYRIEIDGLDAVARRGTSGILFLANHPARIDPMILVSILYSPFKVRPVARRDELEQPIVRWVARHLQAIAIADPARDGATARSTIEEGLALAEEALGKGDNLLVYPGGHLSASRYEKMRGNSGAHTLIRAVPEARVVLISQHGLWGSRFSRAPTGDKPELGAVVRRSVLDVFSGGFFFMPRRPLTIVAEEPSDLPRDDGREALNGYLEAHFNRGSRPNTFVPYSPLDRRAPRQLPDPIVVEGNSTRLNPPEGTRAIVFDRLRQLTGTGQIETDAHLAHDLGCDSLVRAELVEEILQSTGPVEVELEAVRTVADLLTLASGKTLRQGAERLVPAPPQWFDGDLRAHSPALLEGSTVLEVFLRRALAEPDTVILADQTSGVRSYRNLLTGIFVLKPLLEQFPGDRLGLMMPATLAADLLYLSIMAANKTPVMINWTVGPRQVEHGLDTTETRVIVTARALVERLSAQGVSFEGFEDRFRFLEDLVGTVGTIGKLRALGRARMAPQSLLSAPIRDTAAIVFTSGSESLPKAVPLRHANLLANLRDISARVPFEAGDRLLSVLPPFHSFGLTAGMLMPLLNGIPTVHSPNPRDAGMLASLVGAYQATLMGGTPTFLGAMLNVARPGQLDSLRLAVTGGETCPRELFDTFAERCPDAMILEGYGITECSPIVSINSPDASRPGSIGRILPSLESAIVTMESGVDCAPGEEGVLLVRGPSVFDGYLGADPTSGLVEHRGRQWFNTADVVAEDGDGFLRFCGRQRRFVKRAGEMISLPAIESALSTLTGDQDPEEGPVMAVVAIGDDTASETVLCTTLAIEREVVNRQIRAVGLSALHFIHRIVQMAQLPVLGTGKTDYRRLQSELESAGGSCP